VGVVQLTQEEVGDGPGREGGRGELAQPPPGNLGGRMSAPIQEGIPTYSHDECVGSGFSIWFVQDQRHEDPPPGAYLDDG
jgi:hypothetical protein